MVWGKIKIDVSDWFVRFPSVCMIIFLTKQEKFKDSTLCSEFILRQC